MSARNTRSAGGAAVQGQPSRALFPVLDSSFDRLRSVRQCSSRELAPSWTMAMTRPNCFKVGMGIVIATLGERQKAAAQVPPLSLDPSRFPRLGTIDDRFQSYNVEMVEVTGGKFWKPYGPNTWNVHSDLYEYRTPIDLTNARLRRLA